MNYDVLLYNYTQNVTVDKAHQNLMFGEILELERAEREDEGRQRGQSVTFACYIEDFEDETSRSAAPTADNSSPLQHHRHRAIATTERTKLISAKAKHLPHLCSSHEKNNRHINISSRQRR